MTLSFLVQVAIADMEAGVLCELFLDAAAHINAKNKKTGESSNLTKILKSLKITL